VIALWLLGCGSGSVDPDLTAKREALEAFASAKAELERGDAAAARQAFAAVPEVHPIVRAWEAHAAAEAGDATGAVAILDEVVAEHPELGIARYNRAAYLARLGQAQRAADELAVAIELGVVDVREAMADPDFSRRLDHPAFAFLVANALVVAVESPPASTFLGSEVRLTLRITGAGELPIEVESPSAKGPVTLVKHVESVTDPIEGPGRTLTWAWRVEGAGEIVLDPLVVTAGPLSTETSGARVEAAAPPERGDPTDRPVTFPVASAIGADLEVGQARWVEGRLQVKVAGSERLAREPAGPAPRRYTFREGGVTRWVVEEHLDEPPIQSLTRTTGPQQTEPVAIPERPSTGD